MKWDSRRPHFNSDQASQSTKPSVEMNLHRGPKTSNDIKRGYALLIDEPQHAFASLQQSAPSTQHF